MTLVHALHSVEAVWQVGPGAVSVSLVHALHSVEAVWQVGPGAVSVSVATEDDFLVLC